MLDDYEMSKHSQELHPEAKFLVTAKSYLSATFNPNISDFFDLSVHGAPVGCDCLNAPPLEIFRTHCDSISYKIAHYTF